MIDPKYTWLVELKIGRTLQVDADGLSIVDGNLVFSVGAAVSYIECAGNWNRVSAVSQFTGEIVWVNLLPPKKGFKFNEK
jgi:hypothetical protein